MKATRGGKQLISEPTHMNCYRRIKNTNKCPATFYFGIQRRWLESSSGRYHNEFQQISFPNLQDVEKNWAAGCAFYKWAYTDVDRNWAISTLFCFNEARADKRLMLRTFYKFFALARQEEATPALCSCYN